MITFNCGLTVINFEVCNYKKYIIILTCTELNKIMYILSTFTEKCLRCVCEGGGGKKSSGGSWKKLPRLKFHLPSHR